MIIYSVTIIINKDAEKSWLKWMKEIHVADVLRTGYFKDCQIQKLLIPESEEGESTYNINYKADSLDQFQNYSAKEAPRLQKDHSEKFHGKFRASRSVFQLIEK